MPSNRQSVDNGARELHSERVGRYWRIAIVTRFAALVGVFVAVQFPQLGPIDFSLVLTLLAIETLANGSYLIFGFERWPFAAFHFSGLIDILAIGILITVTGGSSSPYVSLFSLVIIFNGAFYGWTGALSGTIPSILVLTAASVAAPDPIDLARLAIHVGVWSGVGFLSAWVGEGEKMTRARLKEYAREKTRMARQFQALYQTSANIQSEMEAEALLSTAIDHTHELAVEFWGEDAVTAISLYDPEKDELITARVAGDGARATPNMRLSISSLPASSRDLIGRTSPYVITMEDLPEVRQLFGLSERATVIAAPLAVGGKTLGVLSVRSNQGAVPTDGQLDLLETIANHIASSLHRVRLLLEERNRRENAISLFELARDLNAVTSTQTALEKLASAGLALVEVDVCGVFLLPESEKETPAWALAGAEAVSAEAVAALRPLETAEVERAIKERRPLEVRRSDEAGGTLAAVARLVGSQRCLIFPVLARERDLGLFCFGHTDESRAFSIGQWQLGESITGLAAVAIENVRNYESEKKAVEELRELDRLKTEMVSTASHELRSPLTSIAGYARTLLRPGVHFTEDERREFLTVIDQQAKQLARLIDELLTVSRIEEGRLALALERVNLASLVLDIITAAKMRTDQHTFELDFPDDLPVVVADTTKLTEIITNLIDNSIKYAPRGGRIQIGAKHIDHEVRIWVSDEGEGIPSQEISNVFKKYFQVEGRPKAGGTGLGLYIVAELVKAHDGRVWVESEMDSGTTFFVAFPQRRATDRILV